MVINIESDNKLYKRDIVMVKCPFKGKFRYRDLFQLFPMQSESAPDIGVINTDHPITIEYQYTPPPSSKDDKVPVNMRNNYEAYQTRKEILIVLSTLTSFRFFLYDNDRQAWFVHLDKKKLECSGIPNESILGQEMYFFEGFNLKINQYSEIECDDIEMLDPSMCFQYYPKGVEEGIYFPNNIEYLLDCYFRLDEESRNVFFVSCLLSYQATEIRYDKCSLFFAALVSSIENLISHDEKGKKSEVCTECGQKRYSLSKKFQDFLVKNGSDTPEYKKFAKELYNRRSKILHAGHLFLADISRSSFFEEYNEKEDKLLNSINRFTKICLINWLIDKDKLTIELNE